MKSIIFLLVMALLISDCNADARILEQIMSKRSLKHKSHSTKHPIKKVNAKTKPQMNIHAVKPAKHKKIAAKNLVLKNVKLKEVVTSKELDIRDDIAYLPNEEKPFTGRHIEYHFNPKKEQQASSQNGLSNTGNEDKKYIEIIYKEGKKEGFITMWDEYGRKIGSIYYKDGKRYD